MNLADARSIAEGLVERMAPFVERIEIAGSIRRQAPQVKDIEIIAIPKWEKREVQDGLFDTKTVRVNLLHEWALTSGVHWIKPGTKEIIPWPLNPQGRYWRGLVPTTETRAIKLDVFLTTPAGWGAILLVRTGSAEFSKAVVTHAKKINRPLFEGRLTIGGQAVETPEEEDVFRLLGLQYVEPSKRLTGWQVGLSRQHPLPGAEEQKRSKCAHPRCEAMISADYLACREHWFMLPESLRAEVWRAHRAGDRAAHRRAVLECFRYWSTAVSEELEEEFKEVTR
jgi:DNA polymerase beta thumb